MPDPTVVTSEARTIDVRKLVALDMVLHGPRFILIEFGVGVILCGGIGLFLLLTSAFSGHGFSLFTLVLGAYLLLMGISYVPLLLHAVDLARKRSAADELAYELTRKDYFIRKYSVQQFVILIPLVVPILAVRQEARRRRGHSN